jgi:DNA-directed RNA polymerase subunit RPC12/RpoP
MNPEDIPTKIAEKLLFSKIGLVLIAIGVICFALNNVSFSRVNESQSLAVAQYAGHIAGPLKARYEAYYCPYCGKLETRDTYFEYHQRCHRCGRQYVLPDTLGSEEEIQLPVGRVVSRQKFPPQLFFACPRCGATYPQSSSPQFYGFVKRCPNCGDYFLQPGD